MFSKNYLPNAVIPMPPLKERLESVSQTSIAMTFVINEGERVRVMEIQFEGNQIFSDKKLRGQMKLVKEAGIDLALSKQGYPPPREAGL